MSKQTITDFLEARIDEDEARAGSGWSRLGDSRWETNNYGQDFLTPSAVLAECAAKRAILQLYVETRREGYDNASAYLWDALYAVASVYKGHPDYRREWSVA